MHVNKCRRQYCGMPLDYVIDVVFGAARVVCPGCERNKRGFCRDCPRRLETPHAMRCNACAHRRALARRRHQNRRYVEGHRRTLLTKARARYLRNREKRIAWQLAYEKRNRAHINAQRRERYAKQRAQERQERAA